MSKRIETAAREFARVVVQEALNPYGDMPAGLVNAEVDNLTTYLLSAIEGFLDREPDEPDGEAFRGREAASFESEQMARIQRENK